MRKRFVWGLVLFALSLVPLTVLQDAPAAAPGSAPDVNFLDAVWVARSGGALKIDAATGTTLFEVTDGAAAETVAVDERRGRTWVFGNDTLRAFGFDGQAHATAPFAAAGAPNPHLAVHDGAVWLGANAALHLFDDAGQALTTVALESTLRDLALDPATGVVRAATRTGVSSFDADGALVGTLPVGDAAGVRAITIDRATSAFWVAVKSELRRYSAGGELELAVPFAGVEHLAADGAGGVWAAGTQRLLRIGGDGELLLGPRGVLVQGATVALAANEGTASVWVATQERLVEVAGDGRRLHDIELQAGRAPVGTTRDLVVYRDLIAPQLVFLSPVSGGEIRDLRPTLELAFTDIGQGVDTTSLTVSANGLALPVSCETSAETATCSPGADLPLGLVTLEATIADFVGNASATAQVSFTVVPENRPPELAAIAPQSFTLGGTLTFTLVATDPDGDLLTFSVAPLPLPAGASLDSNTGVFRFTPTADAVGSFELTFTVSDGLDTASQTVTLTVQPPAPGSDTALSGRLLDTSDFVGGVETPVVGARVSFAGESTTSASTVSDADGRFLLTDIADDEGVLFIDSTQALPAPDGALYASFAEALELIEGTENALDRPIFLPRIDAASLTLVDPSQTTTVVNPTLETTLTVPPATAKNPDGTNFTGELSISAVPEALAPMSLPDEIDPAMLVTVQPVGVSFTDPVAISMPNLDGMPPGAELDLWSVDPQSGEFSIVGTGVVSADGTTIETLTGGIRTASWHAFLGPQPGSNGDDNNGENQDPDKCDDCASGSMTALSSGNLAIAHDLAPYFSLNRSHSLRLIYNSETADPRPVVTSRTTILRRAAVPPRVSAGIAVGGVDFGTQLFTDTSGLSENLDETIYQAVQVDASGLGSGSYPYRLRLTSLYSSSSVSSFQAGQILVNNQGVSPFGAGWGVSGLQRLLVQNDRSLVLIDGDGGVMRFAPAPSLDNGLEMQMFDTSNPVGAVANGFAGLTPGTFRATTSDQSILTDTFTLPVVNFPDNGFDTSAFYNVGPNGFIDGGSSSNAPRGDDLSFQPPGGNDTFGAQFRGFLFLPTGGDVLFTVGVDDAFDLIVNGQRVVAFLGGTNFRNFSGTAQGLPSGFVPITLNYGEIGGEADIVLRASGGGLPGGVIPPSFLFVAASGGGLPDEFVAPAGDFSTLRRNPDGSFTRTFKDGSEHVFDANGLETAAVDANGNTTNYSYDGKGRLTAVTDPVGLVTELRYAGNHLATVTDPAGRVTSFTHDAAGNLVLLIDPDDSVREFFYDERHLLKRQRTKRGFDVVYEYDAAGRNVRTLRPDGAVREIFPQKSVGLAEAASGKDADNPAAIVRPSQVMAAYRDGNGNLTRFEVDRFGGSRATVDALGRRTTATRNEDGNPMEVINPNGSRVSYSYDERGNLLSFSQRSDATSPAQTASFEYDPVLNVVTRVEDTLGQVTVIGYDEAGNATSLRNPLGDVRTATYDARGLLTSMTDDAGRTTLFTYDADGNRATITDPLGVSTHFERDPSGLVTAVVEAAGTVQERRRSFQYDTVGRVIEATDPAGGFTRFSYDASGNLVETRNATGQTVRRVYDSMNRLVEHIDPIRGVTRFTHDGNGNVVERLDARGGRTTLSYDTANRVTATVDPAGQRHTFAYDGRGNLTSLTNPRDETWRFAYDGFDRLVTETDPLGHTTHYAYDARNLLTQLTDAEGQVLTMSHDPLGRLVALSGPGVDVTRAYDAVGNLIAAENGVGRVEVSYDGRNRPLSTAMSVDGEALATLTATYNLLGNRRQLDDSLGGTTRFSYDARGLTTGVVTPGGRAFNLDYDLSGRVTAIGLPNGLRETYVHDTSGRLGELAYEDGAGGSLLDFSYSYDPVGNLLEVIEGTRRKVFAYDALERLVSGGTELLPETYEYDPAGNRTTSFLSASHRHDAANRLLEDDDFTYDYDRNGNLVAKTSRADGSVTRYSYDVLHQLVRVDFPGGGFASYRYDALGRRVEKNVDGEIRRFVHDGSNLVLELDASGTVVARYTHGPGTDQPLALERDGATFSYLRDHQGSVRFLVDETGQSVNAYDYDSFGRVLVRQESVPNPFTYTGRELDAETGFYYYRARYYDPQIGRFVSADPLGLLSGQPNFYAYTSNNPVNSVDPSGLFSFWDALDILSFGLSLKDFIDCPSLENFGWLALDTIGLLPIIPGVGTVRRGIDALDTASDLGRTLNRVDDGVDLARGADNAADAARGVDNAVDATRSADNAADVARGADPVWDPNVGRWRDPSTGRFTPPPPPSEGQRVYRVYGENNNPMGQSWTPVNPADVPDFRGSAGLPDVNSGRFVVEGTITDPTGITTRGALPLDGNPGGLTEYVIPNAPGQVQVTRVSGANPPF